MAATHTAGNYTIQCDRPGCTSTFTVKIEHYTGDELRQRGWAAEPTTGQLACKTCAGRSK